MPPIETQRLRLTIVFDDKTDNNYYINVTVGDFNVAPKHNMDTAGY